MCSNAATSQDGTVPLSAEPPPARQQTADELIAEMKKVPLFMTSMDDLDDESNDMLEAIKAIAYEGTRAEVAENFRSQGNECVKSKQWLDAREFYAKGIAALRGPKVPLGENGILPDAKVVEVDEEAEEVKERVLEEACYTNRALCNLEMKNYGSCNRDCASALRLNPRNVKAWYRAAAACLALDKIEEAIDACQGGLKFDPANVALKTLLAKVKKRQDHLADLEKVRRERDERRVREKATLRLALKERNIISRETANPPDMEDAVVRLADSLDANSTLSLPAILLYPLHAQSDFIKSFAEHETLAQHLDYILPAPWDEQHQYLPQTVECYMETVSGGLIKAGKNLSILKLLGGGKVEVVDGLVRINVVPKAEASEWIEAFKVRRASK